MATEVAVGCNYGPMYDTGYDLTFGSYSYPTADSLWAAWQADPVYLSYIRNPSYRSVGVGRGFGNCFNPMWVVLMSRTGGGGPTVPPPSSTSTATPSPSLEDAKSYAVEDTQPYADAAAANAHTDSDSHTYPDAERHVIADTDSDGIAGNSNDDADRQPDTAADGHAHRQHPSQRTSRCMVTQTATVRSTPGTGCSS